MDPDDTSKAEHVLRGMAAHSVGCPRCGALAGQPCTRVVSPPFGSSMEWVVHDPRRQAAKRAKFSCDYCSEMFTTVTARIKHRREQHPDTIYD